MTDFLHKLYVKWILLQITKDELKEKFFKKNDSELPPPKLRFKIHGSTDPEKYAAVAIELKSDIEKQLAKLNKSLNSFDNILDFGCGCGRITQRLLDAAKPQLYGCDIDSKMISWDQKHIPQVKFTVNASRPPLIYEDDSFDLIIAVSVFSHLNEEYQFLWLEELSRILKPGGLLFITIHGKHAIELINPSSYVKEVFLKKGFVFTNNPVSEELFPEFYGTCYISKDYILENFSKYFEITDYVIKGHFHLQDIVMLRKPVSS